LEFLSSVIHKIKGSSGNIGANDIMNTCIQIEEIIKLDKEILESGLFKELSDQVDKLEALNYTNYE
jgi:HPt (histidine-containing phosphotransfer) domain-containing protein